MILAVAALAVLSSCTNKKTASNVVDNDSTNVADSAATSSTVDLTSVAGTYEGTLPAADCPGIKTVLTLKADSTYQFTSDYIDRKDGHDEFSGIYKMLANGVVMITRPSSGENSFYKVKDEHSLIMTDSLGNEPEGEIAKHYVLTKKK